MLKFPKPLIAIVGDSGTGKSYSLRNLDWNTTAFIDVERKGLPFPTDKFPEANYYPVSGPAEFDRVLGIIRKRAEINTVVVDSLTSLLELEIAASRMINKGYDIYSHYNTRVRSILASLKSATQVTVAIAIPAFIEVNSESGSGVTRRCIATVGKEWQGMIEKEFLAVLCTSVRRNEKTQKFEHFFVTQCDGVNSAKVPPMAELSPLEPNDIVPIINKLCPAPVQA